MYCRDGPRSVCLQPDAPAWCEGGQTQVESPVQRIARCGPSNIARKPSPDVFTSRAPKVRELRPDDGVVRIEQGMPVTVADLR